MIVPTKTVSWKYPHPKCGTTWTMPELTVVGQRACADVPSLLPHVVRALEDFLPQEHRQTIREYDGVLVVTCQAPDSDVRQMAFYREDIPGLPEECQEKVRRWLADQTKTDARTEAEKN
jgi:hypothetical protein